MTVRSGGVAYLQRRRVIPRSTNAERAVTSIRCAAPGSGSAPGRGNLRKSAIPIEPSSAQVAIIGASSIVRWRSER